jgi:hypothetical protein
MGELIEEGVDLVAPLRPIIGEAVRRWAVRTSWRHQCHNISMGLSQGA